MSSINSKNLLIMLVAILILVVVYTENKKSDLSLKEQNITTLTKDAIEINRLKNRWKNSKRYIEKIANILDNSNISYTKSQKSNIVSINATKIPKTELSNIVNIIINRAIKIKSLNIKRVDSAYANLIIEVQI
jgi:hypothetical protein